MEQDIETKINEIIDGFECPKGFSCCTGGFEKLFEAEEIGPDLLLECLEENPSACSFSLHFGDKVLL